MTEPTIVKAMEYLDDDLIAAAAERKAAPRLLTKKKVLALLAACLILVATFAMMGMEEKPEPESAFPDPEELWYGIMDWHIEQNQDDPEMQAFYIKGRELGYDALNPWPDEWQNPDGSFKEFVTTKMIAEVYEGSVLQEYDLSNPLYRGRDVTVQFFFSERRHLLTVTSYLE